MKAHIYKMTCLTNLHVGNGDVNYSIIDNEVERDPVLNEPVIPSSGVKGAILAFMREKGFAGTVREDNMNEGQDINKKEGTRQGQVDCVFGSENRNGEYKFLSAGLLARPIRVTEGEGAYVLATSPDILNCFNNLCIQLGESPVIDHLEIHDDGVSVTNSDSKKAEDIVLEKRTWTDLDKLFSGEPWAVLPHDELREISLPVAARNVLKENGESKNLWYEEYVPHHSVFYLIILSPDENNYLDTELKITDEVVQFGADASIGYGLMKIEKIDLREEKA